MAANGLFVDGGGGGDGGGEAARVSPIAIIHYGSRLIKVPAVTTATALVYFHRYLRNEETMAADGDHHMIACAALFLASKTTDTPRKVRDVLNVAFRLCNPSSPPLTIGDRYYALRERACRVELLMLRAIAFDVAVELPFAYMLNLCRLVIYKSPTDSTFQAVAQTAFTFLMNCYYSSQCLHFTSAEWATAALFFALTAHNVRLSDSMEAWWRLADISEERIDAAISAHESICKSLLTL